MPAVKVLLVFCEGPHDLAFVRIVLQKINSYSLKKLKFSEMPAPFDSLFKTSVESHAAQDMSLDMSHKFFLPDTVLCKNNEVVFLYNCGGKANDEKIKNLLSDYLILLKEYKNFSTTSHDVATDVNYLFLYDADADGLDKIIKNLNMKFDRINDEPFLQHEYWTGNDGEHGKTCQNKAVFVWGRSSAEGTLEDILLPICHTSNVNAVEKIEALLKDLFTWDTENRVLERKIAENSKFKKAVLTTFGQRENPGASMNVFVERGGVIDQNSLQRCGITTAFAKFITDFMR